MNPLPRVIPVLIILLIACGSDRFHTFSDGSRYRLLRFGDNIKDSLPDREVTTLDIRVTCRDNVFGRQESYINLDAEACGKGDWIQKLFSLIPGDSAEFSMPYAMLEGGIFDPEFECERGDTVWLNVGLVRCESLKSYMERSRANFAGDPAEEVIFLRNHVRAKYRHKEAEQRGGAFVFRLAAGNGDSLREGDMVCLHYSGAFLDGEEVDRTPPEGLAFGLGEQGQVINALELLAKTSRDGDSLEVFVPPYMGFGGRAAANGRIPPFTPLVYRVGIHGVSKDSLSDLMGSKHSEMTENNKAISTR